jgi:hypothetical protein
MSGKRMLIVIAIFTRSIPVACFTPHSKLLLINPLTVFWDITLCSLLRLNRRFGGAYRLHVQGRRIRLARNQHELILFFYPEDGGDMFLRNVG